jgi:formamidopyrimidine-DNA glycosylase
MPELPEVETVVRGLRDPLIGHTIQGAIFPAPTRSMTNLDHPTFHTRIIGQTIQGLTRRAKYILCQLSRDTLMVHLKMTGRLYVLPIGESTGSDRYLRVSFPLENGQELRFSDPRRFGRVYLTETPSTLMPDLGPEPLEDSFTLKVFEGQLAPRKGALKPLLLDQSFVAGIGNIYADEALNIAKLHPLRTADSLSKAEIKRLYQAIRQTLREGVEHEGASVNWYRKADGEQGDQQNHLRVYHDPRQEKDKRCPECGTLVAVIRVAQRGTHFCPTCQTL